MPGGSNLVSGELGDFLGQESFLDGTGFGDFVFLFVKLRGDYFLSLPFLHGIVFTLAVLAVLGLARPQILAFTSRITERAAAIQARLLSRLARKPAGR